MINGARSVGKVGERSFPKRGSSPRGISEQLHSIRPSCDKSNYSEQIYFVRAIQNGRSALSFSLPLFCTWASPKDFFKIIKSSNCSLDTDRQSNNYWRNCQDILTGSDKLIFLLQNLSFAIFLEKTRVSIPNHR